MTAFFVRKFKSENSCTNCKKDRLSGYSLCAKHLEAARARFEQWSHERRRAGRCISCDRVSLLASTLATRGKRQLRCGVHARINRTRIAKWIAAHPNYNHDSWLKHKARIIACRVAGHERNGRKVCDGCSMRVGNGHMKTA